MLQILSKQTTEKTVFSENKSKYEALLNELAGLSKESFDTKTNIQLKNEIFKKVMAISARPNPENEKVILCVNFFLVFEAN